MGWLFSNICYAKLFWTMLRQISWQSLKCLILLINSFSLEPTRLIVLLNLLIALLPTFFYSKYSCTGIVLIVTLWAPCRSSDSTWLFSSTLNEIGDCTLLWMFHCHRNHTLRCVDYLFSQKSSPHLVTDLVALLVDKNHAPHSEKKRSICFTNLCSWNRCFSSFRSKVHGFLPIMLPK